MNPALAHIEKTLADSYRKEIDQEENVWRSLPFFAATLALELAAVFQLLGRLPPLGTLAGRVSLFFLVLTGVLMLTALGLLTACIAPTRFRYVSREPLLLRYTDELIAIEEAPENQTRSNPVNALAVLKRELAHQYAVATDHNRQINKRRELRRAFAGLSVVGSVLCILILVAIAFSYYIPKASATGDGHGRVQAAPSIIGSPDRPAGAGSGDDGRAGITAPAAHADHH